MQRRGWAGGVLEAGDKDVRGTRVSYRLQGLNEKDSVMGDTHRAAQKGPRRAGCSDVVALKFLASVESGSPVLSLYAGHSKSVAGLRRDCFLRPLSALLPEPVPKSCLLFRSGLASQRQAGPASCSWAEPLARALPNRPHREGR